MQALFAALLLHLRIVISSYESESPMSFHPFPFSVNRMIVVHMLALVPLCGNSLAYAQTYFDNFPPVIYHTCYDGDTCMVSIPGSHPLFGDHIPVRLAGIDTPEMKGKCDREKAMARQARDLIRDILTHAQQIELRRAHRDKYFRVCARIIADGQDLSELLLLKGMAVPYDGGTKMKNWCVEDEPPDHASTRFDENR